MSAQSDRFRVLRRLTEIRFEDELRGYSKNQVDRVLETLVPLAEDVDDLQAKLADAERRAVAAEAALTERGTAILPAGSPAVAAPVQVVDVASPSSDAPSADFDETLRKTLMLAQQTADTVVREASEEAERVRTSARSEADDLVSHSRFEADRLRSEGEAAKTKMVADVASERGSMLRAAQDSAKSQIAAIEAELVSVHASQRSELVEQIAELQQIRDLLADDIENFEAYLADRRLVVRAAMSEINVVLDDPARIRPAIPPEPSDVDAVDPKVHEPIRVELATLNELKEEGALLSEPGIGTEAELGEVEVATDVVDDQVTEPVVATVDVADDVAESSADTDTDTDVETATETDVENDTARAAGSVGSSSLFGLSPRSHEAPDSADDSDAVMLDALSNIGSRGDADTAQASGPAPDAVGPATEAVPLIDVANASDAEESLHSAKSEDGSPDSEVAGQDDVDGDQTKTAADADAVSDIDAVSVTDPWADVEAAADSSAASDKSSGSAGDAATSESSADTESSEDSDVERPAWADSVPETKNESESSDPFLDELRKATNDQESEDGALSRFLSDDDMKESSRGGWFGRRR